MVVTQTSVATNDIEFKTMLTGQQVEEHVKISIDGKVVCELDAKSGFFGLIKAENKCSFQPTKKVHKYKIVGNLKVEDEKEPYQGKGEGLILNYYTEYEKLMTAKNIDDLFKFYNAGMQAINKELPKEYQLKLLNFATKENTESVAKHIKEKGVILPKAYIEMITHYGYPQNIDTFIPLTRQKSIAEVYLDDYDYPSQYVNTHEGVEKNLAFFNDNDVYYVFHNQTAPFCGEPMIDYTIMTEGDYFPIDANKLESKEKCGSFYKFLKDQVTESFIENINRSFEDIYVLPIYRNTTLEADLSYNWQDENTLEYYFEYNDVFY